MSGKLWWFDRNGDGVPCPPGSRKANRNHHSYCNREWNSRDWSHGFWRTAKLTRAKQEATTTLSPSGQREPALITGTQKPGGVSPTWQKPRLWGMGPAQDLGGAALASGTQISEENIEGWQNSPSCKVPLCRKEYLELEALKKKKKDTTEHSNLPFSFWRGNKNTLVKHVLPVLGEKKHFLTGNQSWENPVQTGAVKAILIFL